MPLVLRSVKGSNLTPSEADGNFTYLDGRVTTLEGLPMGVGIDHITVLGNQMTIYLTDSSIQGPFTIPTASFTYRGDWQASTAYHTNDVITHSNSVYMVLADHTSATDFDPNEVINTATPVYGLLLTTPNISVQTQSGTTWTPGILDANTYNRFTNNSAITLTVPNNSSVAFSIGVQIDGRQAGNGAITIVGASGVTLNPEFNTTNVTPGPGATFTIKKVATNAWDVMGQLTSL